MPRPWPCTPTWTIPWGGGGSRPEDGTIYVYMYRCISVYLYVWIYVYFYVCLSVRFLICFRFSHGGAVVSRAEIFTPCACTTAGTLGAS